LKVEVVTPIAAIRAGHNLLRVTTPERQLVQEIVRMHHQLCCRGQGTDHA
jgi:hypothetical protein